MLKQRIVTAILLVFILLCSITYLPENLFIALLVFVLGIASWEWSRFFTGVNILIQSLFVFVVVILTLIIIYLPQTVHHAVLVLALCWWFLALLMIRSYPDYARFWTNPVWHFTSGLLVLVPCITSLFVLRTKPDGVQLILFCIALIAASDTGAYFTGRFIGKRKLALHVSPNKTWEGFAGGVALAMVVGVLGGRYFLSHLFAEDASLWIDVILLSLSVSVFSVIGDLLESLVKRVWQVKDSGNILPGHGGILDRIDGITAAAPVFTLLYLMKFS